MVNRLTLPYTLSVPLKAVQCRINSAKQRGQGRICTCSLCDICEKHAEISTMYVANSACLLYNHCKMLMLSISFCQLLTLTHLLHSKLYFEHRIRIHRRATQQCNM